MTVLFVIATILFFLAVDWIYLRATGKRRTAIQAAEGNGRTPASIRIPEGIFFSPTHTWMHLYPSGKICLGIDDFIGRLLEKPAVEYLKRIGDRVRKGEPILALKDGERSLTVQSPLDGEILSVNEDLRKQPELLRTELFNAGWAYSMRPQRFSDLKHSYLGGESKTWMKLEYARLRDFFAEVSAEGSLAPAMLQDGGAPMPGIMKSLSPEVWQKFEDEFLTVEGQERIAR